MTRLRLYRESYLEDVTLRQVADSLLPSPAVKPLLGRFFDLVT